MSVGIGSVFESFNEIFKDQKKTRDEDRDWAVDEILKRCSAGGLLGKSSL